MISEKQKKIIQLLSDGGFHSGTELAKTLGISRSAIWKHLDALAQFGLGYTGITGKGYRLDQPLEMFDRDQIILAMDIQAREMISTFEIHDQINSTNSYLLERSHQNAPSGFICLAEHQTAGKGRRGRQWVSPYGCNIYLSILWRFQQSGLVSLSGLSLAIGVAVIRALQHQEIQGIQLKWPNDIYYQKKKLGGILVEVSGESDGPCLAVIGLGLNLFLPETQAESIMQAWTDLTKITGKSRLPRNFLTGALISQMLHVIAEYENTGLQPYLDEWRAYDCLIGEDATLQIANQQITGSVAGIADNGMLLIKKQDGVIQQFASGEVSFSKL